MLSILGADTSAFLPVEGDELAPWLKMMAKGTELVYLNEVQEVANESSAKISLPLRLAKAERAALKRDVLRRVWRTLLPGLAQKKDNEPDLQPRAAALVRKSLNECALQIKDGAMLETGDGLIEISAMMGDERIWFRIPKSHAPAQLRGDAFVVAAMLPAMSLGLPLEIDPALPVDPLLLTISNACSASMHSGATA